MSGHTKGPWEVRRRGPGSSSHEVFESTRKSKIIPLAWVAKLNDGDANARLIAAAPDLLEALEMVRDADDDCKRDGLRTLPAPARAKIDTAIAKAVAP